MTAPAAPGEPPLPPVPREPPADARAAMRAGRWYPAGDPGLIADRARARALLHQWGQVAPVDQLTGDGLLRELLGALGEDCEVLAPLHCDYGDGVHIGERSFVNVGAVILDSAEVWIGDDVQIGPGVRLVTPTHPLDPVHRAAGWELSRPIRIGDGAWLATDVVVCGGVSIGAGSVIGSGSVVTRDMPARHLCHGTPCRPVRPVGEGVTPSP